MRLSTLVLILIISTCLIPKFVQSAHSAPSAGVLSCALETTGLPTPSANHHSIVHDAEIYVIGGNSPTSGVNYDRVLYASTQLNGHITLEGWRSTMPLPLDDTGQSERANSPVVTFNDWIYVLDGSAERPPNRIERDTVCYAPINPDGTIGAWTWTTRMPYAGCEEAVQWDGRIYIIAGWDGYNEHNEVHFAEINEVTGQLGGWVQTTSLPRQLAHGHATIVHNGVIYVLGGHEAIPSDMWLNKVWFASIDEASGAVSSWTETTSLPVTLDNHNVVVLGDEIFVVGGYTHGVGLSNVVYRAHIFSDGSLGGWEEYCYLPEPLQGSSSVVLNDRIYIIGGVSETIGIIDNVYFIDLSGLHTQLTKNAIDDFGPSICADNLGNPHIAWVSGEPNSYDIYYGVKTGDSWTISKVTSLTSSMPFHICMCLDNEGHPYIAALTEASRWDLWYIWWNPATSSWVTEAVANGGSDSHRNVVSLALDSTGTPHIAWAARSGGLWGVFYATKNGDTWSIEPISHADDSAPSIALDSDDNPHVVWIRVDYLINPRLRYASKAGGSWVGEDIPSGAGGYGNTPRQIFIDATDSPHVVFNKHISPGHDELWYGTKTDGAWSMSQIRDSTFSNYHPSIFLNEMGTPYVAWQSNDAGNYDVYLATMADDSWEISQITTDNMEEGNGPGPSLYIDLSNDVHLSWYAPEIGSGNSEIYYTEIEG